MSEYNKQIKKAIKNLQYTCKLYKDMSDGVELWVLLEKFKKLGYEIIEVNEDTCLCNYGGRDKVDFTVRWGHETYD